MILVIIASFDALGIPIISDILNDIFLYIPNVVVTVIVLILVVLFANLFSVVIRTATSNAGMKNAEELGKLAFYAIVTFIGLIALIQLGIGAKILAASFTIAFDAIALALAIAFGLGGKEVELEYLRKWLESNKVDI